MRSNSLFNRLAQGTAALALLGLSACATSDTSKYGPGAVPTAANKPAINTADLDTPHQGGVVRMHNAVTKVGHVPYSQCRPQKFEWQGPFYGVGDVVFANAVIKNKTTVYYEQRVVDFNCDEWILKKAWFTVNNQPFGTALTKPITTLFEWEREFARPFEVRPPYR